jgi:hypothetical protein
MRPAGEPGPPPGDPLPGDPPPAAASTMRVVVGDVPLVPFVPAAAVVVGRVVVEAAGRVVDDLVAPAAGPVAVVVVDDAAGWERDRPVVAGELRAVVGAVVVGAVGAVVVAAVGGGPVVDVVVDVDGGVVVVVVAGGRLRRAAGVTPGGAPAPNAQASTLPTAGTKVAPPDGL